MEAARRLGLEVTVASEEASTLSSLNPSGLMRLDFSDPERAAADVVRFADMYPIAAVIPVDDQVAVCASAIARALGLRHNSVESATAARNKFHMRELLARAGVTQPRYRLASLDDDPRRSAEGADYPCVIKPLSLSGSRGVIRADTAGEFVEAVARLESILGSEFGNARCSADAVGGRRNSAASEARQFLVEEFIPGQEVAVEGVLSRGELTILALFDKPDPLEGPFFEETIYVTPSRLTGPVQEEIACCTVQACRAIGLTHGPVHAELRVNQRGRWVIEVNPRSIGGLCSRVLRFGTGLSLEELIICHALDADYQPPTRERQAAGVMMVPIPRAGVLAEVRGLEDASRVAGIEQIVISAHLGQMLVPLPEGGQYLGFIFARAATPEAVELTLRTAHACLEFRLEPHAS
jgi:biotin carboxylase